MTTKMRTPSSRKSLAILILATNIIYFHSTFCFAAAASAEKSLTVECIRDEEELKSHQWQSTTPYGYDVEGDHFENIFEGKLEKSSGIFYNVEKTFYLYKMSADVIDSRPTYLYLRYYAHPAFLGTETAHFMPTKPDSQEDLEFAKDFTWKEAMAEISMEQVTTGSRIEIQAQLKFGVDPDYILIDTIILFQGETITNVSDVRNLCPPKEVVTTPPPTEPGTETTSTTPFFDLSTTTELPEPSDSIFECIDVQDDFEFFGWDSYPHHKYVEDGQELPFFDDGGGDRGQGETIEGKGIFYFEGSLGSKLHLFFKDYTPALQNFPEQQVYAYLNYYVHRTNVSSLAADLNDEMDVYIQPVENCAGDYIKPLSGLQKNFQWEQKLIQLDTANGVVGALIELGLHNLPPGDYFLLDKIVVASAPDLVDLLRQIESCI